MGSVLFGLVEQTLDFLFATGLVERVVNVPGQCENALEHPVDPELGVVGLTTLERLADAVYSAAAMHVER